MKPLAKDLPANLNRANVLDNHFMQLLNSLSGIRTITNLGNQQINEEDSIDQCMRTIVEYLEVETTALYLLEGESLNCVARLNWDQYIKRESSLNKNNAYSLTKSIIEKTAANKKVVHIQDFKTSDENLIQYTSKENNIGSIICAPILVNYSIFGVLELTHPDTEHFNAWQEHSVAIYADLIGMLLNNIKLTTSMKTIIEERTQDLNSALVESEKLRTRYEEMSVIDPLTKLYNRRFFFTEASAGLARAKRYAQEFSLLLMDLDFFKQVNDSYGHEAGDAVLVEIARILNDFTRVGDTLARIGGEEFLLALPLTDTIGATILAERIRLTIANHKWNNDGEKISISMSIGIAALTDCTEDEDHVEEIQVSDILRKADLALYHVKRHGRNSVKAFSEIT